MHSNSVDFQWWVSTNHRGRKKHSASGWWCGACGLPNHKKPTRLLTVQIGDTANEQAVFLARGAPDGERDNVVTALNLVTHLTQENEIGVEVKGLAGSSKSRLAETGGVVHFGGQCKSFGCRGRVGAVPSLNKECTKIGDSLCGRARNAISRKKKNKWKAPLMDWVVLRQAQYQSSKEEEWNECMRSLQQHPG